MRSSKSNFTVEDDSYKVSETDYYDESMNSVRAETYLFSSPDNTFVVFPSYSNGVFEFSFKEPLSKDEANDLKKQGWCHVYEDEETKTYFHIENLRMVSRDGKLVFKIPQRFISQINSVSCYAAALQPTIRVAGLNMDTFNDVNQGLKILADAKKYLTEVGELDANQAALIELVTEKLQPLAGEFNSIEELVEKVCEKKPELIPFGVVEQMDAVFNSNSDIENENALDVDENDNENSTEVNNDEPIEFLEDFAAEVFVRDLNNNTQAVESVSVLEEPEVSVDNPKVAEEILTFLNHFHNPLAAETTFKHGSEWVISNNVLSYQVNLHAIEKKRTVLDIIRLAMDMESAVENQENLDFELKQLLIDLSIDFQGYPAHFDLKPETINIFFGSSTNFLTKLYKVACKYNQVFNLSNRTNTEDARSEENSKEENVSDNDVVKVEEISDANNNNNANVLAAETESVASDNDDRIERANRRIPVFLQLQKSTPDLEDLEEEDVADIASEQIREPVGNNNNTNAITKRLSSSKPVKSKDPASASVAAQALVSGSVSVPVLGLVPSASAPVSISKSDDPSLQRATKRLAHISGVLTSPHGMFQHTLGEGVSGELEAAHRNVIEQARAAEKINSATYRTSDVSGANEIKDAIKGLPKLIARKMGVGGCG